MQTIRTKYLGPTNFRSARIKASASGGRSKTAPYDYSRTTDQNHEAAARDLAAVLDWQGPWIGEDFDANGYVFICTQRPPSLSFYV